MVWVGVAGMPLGLTVVGESKSAYDGTALRRIAHVNMPKGQRKVHGKREKRKP